MADLSKPLRTMKRILILLLALIPFVAGAQELTIDSESGIITSTGIKEINMTQDDILQYILAYNVLDNVVTHNNMIAGDIKPTYLNYASAGYTRMKVPLYLSNGRFTARLVLWFKDGRYRYEIYNMRFVDTQSSMPGTTFLHEVSDSFGFDIACKLIIHRIGQVTTFYPIDNNW